jgi:hypothetical protein
MEARHSLLAISVAAEDGDPPRRWDSMPAKLIVVREQGLVREQGHIEVECTYSQVIST